MTLIIKNEKWKKWSAISREEAIGGKMNKWPERKMKYDVGQVHGCWTITNRLGSIWEITCTCGKIRFCCQMPNPESRCCHTEQLKAGAKLGNLTVCTPLKLVKRTVKVECGCGYKWMANSTHVTNERYRRFYRCRGCGGLWEG